MPNWCMNTLTVSGGKKDIIEFAARAITETDKKEVVEFSFAPFLPMPKELEGTTSPEDKPNKKLVEAFGYSNWYDRNCGVLGTKWDVTGSLDQKTGSSVRYTFDSAWAPPSEGVRRLSEMYPKLRFKLEYDEPGMDVAGTQQFRDGELISDLQTRSPSNAEEAEEPN